MGTLDIHNPEHKTAIQEVLRQGAASEFWSIMCQRIQESLDALQSQIDGDNSNLIASEYKILLEVLKKQKIDRLDILNMPADLTREMDNPEFFKQDREEEVYLEKEDFETKP
jgi:hypothetical protein